MFNHTLNTVLKIFLAIIVGGDGTTATTVIV